MAKLCVPIVRLRQQTADKLNNLAQKHYQVISDRERELLAIRFSSQLEASINPQEDLFNMLQKGREDDIRRLFTSFGPHRDDLAIYLGGREIKTHGSQGQIRTAALSLRLSEMDILTSVRGDPPLLLLDDVLSELDMTRRTRLIGQLKNVQTLITCTDIKELRGAKPDCVLTVHDGIVN